MERKKFFAVGTTLHENLPLEVEKVASCVNFIIENRNVNGTWGSNDPLDSFICTNHAVMALLSVGFTPHCNFLKDGVTYLVGINKEEQISFFWRAGTLLNIADYRDIVNHDIEYLWKFRKRIGVHKDYPVPFFLLKLIKYYENCPNFSFTLGDVLQWILEEWDESECWYGRTSITSMSLALIYDIEFNNNGKIIEKCFSFLESKYTSYGKDRGTFSDNIVEDCFLVFNLFESNLFNDYRSTTLEKYCSNVVNNILHSISEKGFLESMPPFGGKIDTKIYPTSVAIRAVLSYYCLRNNEFYHQLLSAVLTKRLIVSGKAKYHFDFTPFWGEYITGESEDVCFVLMPFSDKKLNDIYYRHIKKPIEEYTSIKCMRADDIFKSSSIMNDIWSKINTSRFIIADMTHRNPNVFYELGLCHSIGKKVILISQSIDDVPFDLRGVRTIIYDDSLSGYDNLTEKVISYIKTELE